MNELIKNGNPDFSITPDLGIDEAVIKGLAPLLKKEREIQTTKGFAELKIDLSKVKSLRIKIDKRRKELKADSLAYGRRVDDAAKHLVMLVSEVETPLKELKDAEEARRKKIKEEKIRIEQERVNAITKRIADMARLAAAQWDKGAPVIEAAIKKLTDDSFDYQEFVGQAATARVDAIAEMERMIAAIKEREEQAERERVEREKSEAAAKIAAERLRIEQENAAIIERERLERERKEQEAAAKIERERLEAAAIESERLRKEQAEAARVEAERLRAARAEAERLREEQEAEAEKARAELEALKKEITPAAVEPEPAFKLTEPPPEDLGFDKIPRIITACSQCAACDMSDPVPICTLDGELIEDLDVTEVFPSWCPLKKVEVTK